MHQHNFLWIDGTRYRKDCDDNQTSSLVNDITLKDQSSQKIAQNFNMSHSSVSSKRSLEDEESLESTKQRGREKYFLEGGEGPGKIQDDEFAWILTNNTNLSRILHDYRNKSIERIEKRGYPNSIYEQLAINAIFWISDDGKVRYRIPKADWEPVASCFAGTNNTHLDEEVGRKVLQLAILCRKDSEASIQECMKMMNLCLKDGVLETVFASNLVEPLIIPFLPMSDYVEIRGSTSESQGSKMRRGSYGRKPDLSLVVNFYIIEQVVLVCEIKTPDFVAANGENYDFVKTMNIMKDELDHCATISSKQVPMYSLVIEGYKCRVFEMKLTYRKTYTLRLINQFFLSMNKHDLERTSACFDALLSLRAILEKTSAVILNELLEVEESNGPFTMASPDNICLETFDSPQSLNLLHS